MVFLRAYTLGISWRRVKDKDFSSYSLSVTDTLTDFMVPSIVITHPIPPRPEQQQGKVPEARLH